MVWIWQVKRPWIMLLWLLSCLWFGCILCVVQIEAPQASKTSFSFVNEQRPGYGTIPVVWLMHLMEAHIWKTLQLFCLIKFLIITISSQCTFSFRQATTRSCKVLLKVFLDSGWERKNGKIEKKILRGVYEKIRKKRNYKYFYRHAFIFNAVLSWRMERFFT